MARRVQTLKDHWREHRLFLTRIIGAAVIVLLLTGVLIARLVQLQVVDYQRFSELSQGNRLRIEPLAPTRGLIFDRNGEVVAENLPTWQLVVVPEQIVGLDKTLRQLEALKLLDPAQHKAHVELIRSHRGFDRVKLRNLNETEAARFAVRRHRFPGIDIQEGLMRYYPYGEAAAHAVGYVGSISISDLQRIDQSNYAASSHIGKTGIERSYESLLHGQVGYRQQVVNAQGRVLLDPAADHGGDDDAALGGLKTKWPVPGENLVLSLDIRVQLAAQQALAGKRGAAVAVDPNTGDVLALVSSPSFDPNRVAAGLSPEDYNALNRNPNKPLFNRAVAGQYPPGSTIKPFIGLAGLYYKAVTPEDHYYCPGYYTLPGNSHRYRGWRHQGHGSIDLHDAIVESCDVYFYNLAVALGIDKMEQMLKLFGFGAPSGLDIAGENAGVVPSREWKRKQFSRPEDQVWFPGETVITGIGQGFTLVTPVQLASAVATLSVQGKRFKPRLLIATEDPLTREVHWKKPEPAKPIDDVAEDNWQVIHDAMVGVTQEVRGTGHKAMLGTPYTVAGKTGTAQLFTIDQGEHYDEDEVAARLRDNALFEAYAPADAPQIAVAVVVENGGEGGDAAAPVARKMLDAWYAGRGEGKRDYVARQH
ncbi:MAG TPA: penicillin-binding protein 2 [Gammaproteobacteria bacterium]|nr:penicillin-binding protein 2 [Gammaproteobacteria bacterium]